MGFTIVSTGKKSVKEGINAKARQRRKRLAEKPDTKSGGTIIARNSIPSDLKVEQRSPGDLTPSSRRTRKSNPAHVDKVYRSIVAFGFCKPVLIEADGTIIDGHICREAALRLGMETIPCIVVDHLTRHERRLLAITLNRLAEDGEWDVSMLEQELTDLKELDLDLSLTGFEGIEIDVMLDGSASRRKPGKINPRDDTLPIISRPGDLWVMGDHRLLNADSLDSESYVRLMEDMKAVLVFSDPPYNCPIEGFVSGKGKVRHKDFAMACGEMSPAEFQAFLYRYLALCRAHTISGALIYACMDWRQDHRMVLAGEEAKLSHVHKCVWDKGVGAMGSLYRNAHELINVFCNGKTPKINNIQLGRFGRDRTNVLHYPGANQPGSSAAKALKLHATPKPVEMVEDFMLDASHRGDIVLDPFMGSGTTIIAAEQCGRQARGIEIEPLFVDRAIRRWEELTGKQAIHAETGLSLADMAAERANTDQ